MAAKKTNTGAIIGTVAGVGLILYVVYAWLKRPKSAQAATMPGGMYGAGYNPYAGYGYNGAPYEASMGGGLSSLLSALGRMLGGGKGGSGSGAGSKSSGASAANSSKSAAQYSSAGVSPFADVYNSLVEGMWNGSLQGDESNTVDLGGDSLYSYSPDNGDAALLGDYPSIPYEAIGADLYLPSESMGSGVMEGVDNSSGGYAETYNDYGDYSIDLGD